MTADRSIDAGWYQDPSGRYGERWWDGTSWTGHVRGRHLDDVDTIEIAAVRASNPSVTRVARRRAPFWARWTPAVLACVYGGAAAVAIGAALPWASVSGDAYSATARGTDGDGVVTLVLALAFALVFTVLRSRRAAATLALCVGVVVALVAGYDLIDLSHKTGDAPTSIAVSVRPGIGLLLTGIGAVAIAVGAALALGEAEGRARSTMTPAGQPG
jgi:hypothetical protein